MGHGGTAAHSTLFGARFELPRLPYRQEHPVLCFRRRRVTLNFRKSRFGKSFCQTEGPSHRRQSSNDFHGPRPDHCIEAPERCAHHVGWRSLRACGRLRSIFAVRPARACGSGAAALPANESDVPVSCAATIVGRMCRGTGVRVVRVAATNFAPRRIALF